MGGLSSDPAKAQRQREALAAGRRKMAERILAGDDPPPPAKAKTKAPAKAPAKASKGKRTADPDRVRYSREDDRAPAPRRDRDRDRRDDRPPKRPGFIDGLLGRI